MNVLVDTSVWSLALRRSPKQLNPEQEKIRNHLAELIREGRAKLAGLVRQELLSGVRAEAQYEQLRLRLLPFDDVPLGMEDYENAARISNQCRARGIAGSLADFLICAIALRRDWQIFTTDHDFVRYARCVPLRLIKIRESA